MKEGTEIITTWANINIQRLIHDRYHDILVKASNILKELTSFFTETIGNPTWKSIPSNKYIPLFLFKFYFSNQYIDTKDITNFLEITVETILNMETKLLTDATSDKDIELILSTINFNNIDPDKQIDEEVISETPTAFDQILRSSTIDLWNHQKNDDKQTAAAQNLKSRMHSKEIVTATTATALAITKSTKNEATTKSQHLS
jgi:hypothetical protein